MKEEKTKIEPNSLRELHEKTMSFLRERRRKKKLFRPGRPRIPGRILVRIVGLIDAKKEGEL